MSYNLQKQALENIISNILIIIFFLEKNLENSVKIGKTQTQVFLPNMFHRKQPLHDINNVYIDVVDLNPFSTILVRFAHPFANLYPQQFAIRTKSYNLTQLAELDQNFNSFSLLDNAPNQVVGCIIPKQTKNMLKNIFHF